MTTETNAVNEIKEGWQVEKLWHQRVYHYILDTFSLCGKLGFYTGELATDQPEKRGCEDCKACIKKLDVRIKRNGRSKVTERK